MTLINKISVVFSIIVQERDMFVLITKIGKCTLINYAIYKHYTVIYFKLNSNKLKDIRLIKNQINYDLKISYYSFYYFFNTEEQIQLLRDTKDRDKLMLNDDKMLIDFIVMHYYFKNKNYTRGVRVLR